ncbi:hypothetical protein [Butyrivibrio sp. FC2001]|uniref:hypothetical protein n=1 Tax=Butyrivibrio sp. FC2001 TaxID=1280671 RepID=UPI00042A27D8|nr:hypothetical protein [Butyrivibrio sp. FC2001]
MDYRDNIEIDLIDLAKELLAKWKIVLLSAVIGAVLMGGYGYMKSGHEVDVQTGEAVTENESSKLASLRGALSESDAAVVESMADQYLTYAKEYAYQLEYVDNSILMNLDAYKVQKLTSYYAINNCDYELKQDSENDDSNQINLVGADSTISKQLYSNGLVVSDANNVAAIFRKELLNKDVLAKAAEVTENEYSEEQMAELITVEIDANSILAVSVRGFDEDISRQIMDIVTENIDSVAEKAKTAFEFDMSYINSYYSIEKDTGLIGIKQSAVTYLHTLKSNMVYMNNSIVLTADQKNYYAALTEMINKVYLDKAVRGDIDADNVAEINSIDDLVSFDDGEEVETRIVRSFNKKYIALGAFAGMFVAMLAYAALYVLLGKLHTESDMRDAFGVPVIGTLPVGDKDKLNNKLDLVASELSISASKAEAKKACLVGTSSDAESKEIKRLIQDKIAGGITTTVSNNIFTDPKDLHMLSESDVAILVEKANESKLEDIARELELCKNCGVRVLGAVVLK